MIRWIILAKEPDCRAGVVLPDAASGSSPVRTLAIKLSRCKEGMAHFLPSGYKFYQALRVSRYKVDRSRESIPGYKVGGGHWRSVAIQVVSEPEICQGAGFKLRADRVSGCNSRNESVLRAGVKAKSVTNNLPILSVLGFRCNFFCPGEILSKKSFDSVF
jgi:hypothetical protein